MADNLKPDSLAWALAHVRRFGDTDIFPSLFEYDALAHDWSAVGPSLQSIDLAGYKIRADSRVMVVKPGGGFRAATQLDPIDHLLYTAAVYEAADLIEKARVPADQKIACSYRICITPQGAFFPPDSGWKDYHAHSRKLAQAKGVSHVLTADISDFYNQLSQHRIQNAMELASVHVDRSENIEALLNHLAGKQSQGLPVGPIASIVLAEASLIDVDNFLLRHNVPYVRYVDDFRIFCSSRKQAVEVKHALAEYLFSAHRLSLESAKSSITHVDKFIKEELSDPEELEQQARVDRINEIFEELSEKNGPYWYEDVPDDVEAGILNQAQKESFIKLFEECVARRPLHLGLARYLLRKGLKSRTNALNGLVFDNLEVLTPALRDAVRYLSVTIPKARASKRGKEILTFCKKSAVGTLPFVRMWVLELLYRRPDLCPATEALALAEESASELGHRPTALLAAAYKQFDWVRARKETWRNYEPWARRALIWSASILPSGERKPFLAMVVSQGDMLDAAVAKYLLSKK
ncbi:MAG: RNA-directed DNA polymerase [Acidobacteriaceae bacterium]